MGYKDAMAKLVAAYGKCAGMELGGVLPAAANASYRVHFVYMCAPEDFDDRLKEISSVVGATAFPYGRGYHVFKNGIAQLTVLNRFDAGFLRGRTVGYVVIDAVRGELPQSDFYSTAAISCMTMASMKEGTRPTDLIETIYPVRNIEDVI